MAAFLNTLLMVPDMSHGGLGSREWSALGR